jgi:hypothetical protein
VVNNSESLVPRGDGETGNILNFEGKEGTYFGRSMKTGNQPL